jgi:hypothetical protein
MLLGGDGGKKAVHRGEHEVSCKAIAQGRPECSRCPVCSCALLFAQSHARPRVQQAPGLPCALCFRARSEIANLGRNAPRECKTVSTVIASAAKQSMSRHKERVDCFAEPVIGRRFAPTRWLAMTWRGRALSSQGKHFRATHRRTAVEIATCPRQCAVALRSNFCRHMHRIVNTQADVLSSAQTSLADGSLRAHSRPLPQRYVTMPVRSVRYRARRGLYGCSTLGDKK